MLDYQQFTLENGLRFLVHEDSSTPTAALSVLYEVGSRDEHPERTGMAHLFEHLMFSGSANIPDFDDPVQNAGGENNAFTNNDHTNFYETFPAQNIETAFWLESDRMLSLNFDQKQLETQQKVVIEEFKETTLNEPYGDVWHHLSEMAYTDHPYRWPVIGLTPEHVEAVTMDDVHDFYFKHYRPNNAIVVVAGNIKTDKVRKLSEKWFGDIPKGNIPEKKYQRDTQQRNFQRKTVESNVPVNALYMAFNMCDRWHPDFYTIDTLSDILANGRSSRLYANLLKNKRLFSSIDASLSATLDPGLFIIEGKLQQGVSQDAAENAIWEEIYKLQTEPLSTYELQKIKNQMESALLFSESGALNKALNFAFYESIGDATLINREMEIYNAIQQDQLQLAANQLFTQENCSILMYKSLS